MRFDPPLRERDRLLRRLESGHTIRVLRAARRRLAPRTDSGRAARPGRPAFRFLHSIQPDFPVWWSQAPDPVLVGWMGGPAAAALAGETPRRIYLRSITALAQLLRLKERSWSLVLDYRVHDWSADPYTRACTAFPWPERKMRRNSWHGRSRTRCFLRARRPRTRSSWERSMARSARASARPARFCALSGSPGLFPRFGRIDVLGAPAGNAGAGRAGAEQMGERQWHRSSVDFDVVVEVTYTSLVLCQRAILAAQDFSAAGV